MTSRDFARYRGNSGLHVVVWRITLSEIPHKGEARCRPVAFSGILNSTVRVNSRFTCGFVLHLVVLLILHLRRQVAIRIVWRKRSGVNALQALRDLLALFLVCARAHFPSGVVPREQEGPNTVSKLLDNLSRAPLPQFDCAQRRTAGLHYQRHPSTGEPQKRDVIIGDCLSEIAAAGRGELVAT